MQVGKDDLGSFLRKKREDRNISLRQLEKISKEQIEEGDRPLTYSHISKIETSEISPSLRTLQKIAAALDLPLVIVFNGEKSDPDAVTVLSTEDFSQTLLVLLRREEIVKLMLLCEALTTDQIKLLSDLAASLLPRISSNPDEGN